MRNFIFTALFYMAFLAAFWGCAALDEPKDIKTLTGEEKTSECLRLRGYLKSLESHLLSIDECYANPSTANDCIQTSAELERGVAYFNQVCAGQK